MVAERAKERFREDTKQSGKLLSAAEREELLRPYLPQERDAARKTKSRPIRTFFKGQLDLFVYTFIHLLFSIYIHGRQALHAVLHRVSAILYYHHRTPELIRNDVKGLSRLPQHLSVVLDLQPDDHRTRRSLRCRSSSGRRRSTSGGGSPQGLTELLDNVAEIAAWCASAGTPLLSVYEATGALKAYLPDTHAAVAAKLHAYFGVRRPSLQVRAPHQPSFLNGDSVGGDEGPAAALDTTDLGHLSLLLLSADDGRSTMIDLTKTLAEMAQRGRLQPSDVSPELVDAEITESIMGEPDLLMLFGPVVRLRGYPPWQLRLTEIFHVQDSSGVEYLVWLKGLYSYSKAQMRFGR